MIKQFTINLNKGEGEAVLKARVRERRSLIYLAIIAVVLIVLSGFTWVQHRELRDIVKSKQDKITDIQHQLDSLRREGTKVSKQDIMALAKLEKDRFLWAARLEALAHVLPDGMAITGLKFEHNRLVIKAISKIKPDEKEFERVSRLMDILETTPEFASRFRDIRFTQSKRRQIEDQEVLELVITCFPQQVTVEKKQQPRSVEQSIRG
ncbi:PilN domain-containing protein [bacterium]|nr:PilN domain-containing protein [bacterium]MBU1937211.1 PilN domain-containing protein [bacterium]